MSNLVRKKLTGWLILLIILIGPLQFGGAARSLSTVPDSFRPHLAEYPSLSTALIIFQLLIGGSIAVWAYTAWVLFRFFANFGGMAAPEDRVSAVLAVHQR